jgi:hypothetical protein
MQDVAEEAALSGLDAADVENYEPLDGCRQRDVGWMNVSYMDLISWYCEFDGRLQNWWEKIYLRPPMVKKY